MADEFYLNGKKINRDIFRENVKKNSATQSEKFRKILSAFDTENLGTIDDFEIDNLFNKLKQLSCSNNNNILENFEAETFLNNTIINGKSLKSDGISTADLFGFIKSNTNEYYYLENIDITQVSSEPLTEKEVQTQTINFLETEYINGIKMLNEYDPGFISKGYNNIKEFLKSNMSESSVKRALFVKLETANLLQKAQNAELTKDEYYTNIKEIIYSIFPGLENMSDKDKENLKKRIDTLSPNEIHMQIDNILSLPNKKDKNYNTSINLFLDSFVSSTTVTETYEVEGQKFSRRISKPQYNLDNGKELITFNEVFHDRFGKNFSQEKYQELVEARNKLSLMSGARASYNQAYDILHSQITACEGLMEPGRGNEQTKNTQAISLQNKILEVLTSLGYTEPEQQNEFLKKVSGSTLELSNTEEESLQIQTVDIKNVTYIAKQLLMFLDKNAPSTEMLTEQANIVGNNYKELFGNTDTEALTNSYIQDSENAVTTLRSGTEMVLGTGAIVSMFICPPLALGLGIASPVTGIGLDAANEISRKNPSMDKFKELGQELAVNAGLFASGFGAAKAGMAAKVALIAKNCPKLVACIADVGADVTLSAVSNLVLTGDLQIEQEGFAQVVSLLAGHIKAGRFKINKTKTKVEQDSPSVKDKETSQDSEIKQKQLEEQAKEQIKEQQRIAKEKQKIAEQIGDDFKISEEDSGILHSLNDGEYHVITDKNGNQIKITKNGDDFDIEIMGKTEFHSVSARGDRYGDFELKNGRMHRGDYYILNPDILPKIDIGGGEYFDLELPDVKKALMSLNEGQEITIGRDGTGVFRTNQNNGYSSREHLKIRKTNDRLIIQDVSTNGSTIIRDATAIQAVGIHSGPMTKNIPYVVNENDLPKLILAGRERLDLNKYKKQISELKEGQILTVGAEGVIPTGSSKGYVSGRHLIIYRSNGVLKIKDISTNGTVIESTGVIDKIKNKIKKAMSYFDSSELSKQELNVLKVFENNPAVKAVIGNASASKKMAKNIMKVINNPKLVPNEIREGILTGQVNFTSKDGLVKCSTTKNILDDIVKLANGEDYIKKYSRTTSKFQIMKETPLGEVANIDGTLYVNNGRDLERINMSEKTFKKLFPPIKRFNTHQGSIGTCYLVSVLENLYSKPLGRVEIYRMIGEDANGIYTTTANSNGHKNYFKRFDSQHKHILDETGLAIIEQGYCKNEISEAIGHNPRETIIMVANDGGWAQNAIRGLLGKEASYTNNDQSMRNYIMKYANNDNFILNAASRSGSDSNVLAKEYNVYYGHEYSIKGYDSATDSVIIANPWHSGFTTKIPMSEFLEHFNSITVLNLA